MTEPLLNMKSSSWVTGLPQRLKAYDNFLEVTSMERNMVSRTTQRTRYEQIAQTSVRRHLFFCDLIIETTGGHTLAIAGLLPQQAQTAREFIEQQSRQPH